MDKPVLAILAAGMGSRYGGLKQMDPMDEYGNLIIDFDIHDALKAGFSDIVFIIKQEIAEDFKQHIGTRMEQRANVRYAYQEMDKLLPAGVVPPAGRKKPWGTTHAVLCAEQEIAGRPFAIINADDYYGPAAFSLLYGFLSTPHDKNEHALIGYHIENTLTEHGSVARGLCQVNENGYLTGIRERTKVVKTPQCAAYTEDGAHFIDVPFGTTVSMNCWGFNSGIMEGLKRVFTDNIAAGIASNPEKYEDLLPNAVQLTLDSGATVQVLDTPDSWFGVTYQQDKPVVMQRIRELKAAGVYSEKVW